MAKRIPQMDEILAVAATRGANSEAPYLWKDLVGAWPLQEGEGPKAYDVSGYGRHGTVIGPVQWTSHEALGRCWYSNGIDQQYIQASPLYITDVYSASIWIFVEELFPSYPHFFSWGFFRQPLYYESGITVRVYTDTSPMLYLGSNINPTGALHHAAWTYDGSTACLYVDGRRTNSGARTGPMSVSNSPVIIGSTKYKFRGYEALAQSYHRALSASEVGQLYEDPWAMYRIRPKVFRVAALPEEPTIFRRRLGKYKLGSRELIT